MTWRINWSRQRKALWTERNIQWIRWTSAENVAQMPVCCFCHCYYWLVKWTLMEERDGNNTYHVSPSCLAWASFADNSSFRSRRDFWRSLQDVCLFFSGLDKHSSISKSHVFFLQFSICHFAFYLFLFLLSFPQFIPAISYGQIFMRSVKSLQLKSGFQLSFLSVVVQIEHWKIWHCPNISVTYANRILILSYIN